MNGYRYDNSDEELYDEAADPLEYKNLATLSEHAQQKAELAKWLPKVNAANLPSGGGKGQSKKKKPR